MPSSLLCLPLPLAAAPLRPLRGTTPAQLELHSSYYHSLPTWRWVDCTVRLPWLFKWQRAPCVRHGTAQKDPDTVGTQSVIGPGCLLPVAPGASHLTIFMHPVSSCMLRAEARGRRGAEFAAWERPRLTQPRMLLPRTPPACVIDHLH